MTTWNPALYLSFGDQRLRPALDLLAQVPAEDPATVYDLGCGPGNVTLHLRQRWPDARIVGVDSSADMLQQARALESDIAWVQADLNAWTPEAPADVFYSNATLQWLDDHESLFPRLLDGLKPGGVFAVQVPNNFRQPSHTCIADAVQASPWRERMEPHLRAEPVLTPEEYYRLLRPLATHLDLWETVYHQQLEGEDPVVTWTMGTFLRPLLDQLDEAEGAAFVEDYRQRVRKAYPPQADGATILPFHRIFMVAVK